MPVFLRLVHGKHCYLGVIDILRYCGLNILNSLAQTRCREIAVVYEKINVHFTRQGVQCYEPIVSRSLVALPPR